MNQKTQLTPREKDALSYLKTLKEDANTKKLIESWEKLFKDKESRHLYANDFLDSSIAMQIRVLREQRNLTQKGLAEKAEMKQERISLMESMSYSGWSLNVLRRLAGVFDLRLVVEFEDFGSYVKDYFEFERKNLERKSFEDDPVFNPKEYNIENDLTFSNKAKPSQYATEIVNQLTVTLFPKPELLIQQDMENGQGFDDIDFSEEPHNNATQFATV